MLTLIKYGLDRQKAFLISEQIRKGKGFTNEQYDELLDLGVPNWYLDLCNKIEYLSQRHIVLNMFAFHLYWHTIRHISERNLKKLQKNTRLKNRKMSNKILCAVFCASNSVYYEVQRMRPGNENKDISKNKYKRNDL